MSIIFIVLILVFHCVKKDNKQNNVLNDGEIFCCVPLDILALKLTLVTAKKLVVLHNMHMPSKILLKNAQILLGEHKFQTWGSGPLLHMVCTSLIRCKRFLSKIM